MIIEIAAGVIIHLEILDLHAFITGIVINSKILYGLRVKKIFIVPFY